jgi:hypothetical protein
MIFPRVLADSPIVSTDPCAEAKHGRRAISFVASPNGGTFLLSDVGDEAP